MESKLPHTNDEQEVPISQHTGHHDQNEDEHHGEEKKSVFKKFKAKAKKLKNTITKQGQGQDHDDVDDDGDDDDDEEDETVEDHEVHGAPKYDSALGGPDAKVAQPKDNLESYTKPVASHVSPLTVPATGAYGTNLSGQSELGGQDVNPEKRESKIGHTGGKETGLSQVQHSSDKIGIQDSGSERPEHPENLPRDTLAGNQSTQSSKDTENISSIANSLSGLGLGLGSDPANHETKVSNPTHTEGGKEAGLSQVQHPFDKLGILNSGSERIRFDPEHPDNLPRNTLAGNQSTQNSSYTEKISSIASAISEKAVVAKDAIALKFGYSGEHPTTTESHENAKNSGSTATDYAHSNTHKVTQTSPVYDKVVDAGNWVMSKMQGTVSGTGSVSEAGTGHQQMHGTETVMGTDKGVSVKEGDEEKAHDIHRGNQDKSGENKPMGKVTESVEVRSRLGTDGNEGHQQQQSSNVSTNDREAE